LALALSIAGVCTAQTTPPDLTAPGAIAALKTNANGNATPVYADTFNLGPTGLRGWIHCHFDGFDFAASGRISDASRQILVTTASTPATVNNALAVDDVILGAIAANSGTVPSFSSDARKAFGTAITNAEKTGAGSLRVKRWRAGATTEVNITIPTLGEYSATAPYNCPKSSAILANTRNQMVGELIANSNYLDSGHSGAINALALLASVPYVVNPGDPNESNYSQARTRLQTYARSLSIPPFQWAQDQETWIWGPAYQLTFLSEYYLLTNDSQVVPTINGFALWLAEFQSMFGTFGHGPGGLFQDASGRRYASGYGPVNAVGNVANLALVLGKKALLAASQPIDPKINAAIQRGTGFLGSYVNKGGIPYGEHMPTLWHASNGKDPAAAVFFGLQADRAVETEYFSRMSIASWVGVEVGHAGQEMGILWAVLGAGMGGETAASAHFKQLLWRFDLTRRTNGSFTHDGTYIDYYGGGSTENGTYLGNSAASGVKGTAIHLLAYSLPLKQLHITGKQANPAYTLDSTKVANAVSAGYFRVDRANLTVPQLFTALGDYDPVVRYYASLELAAETLSSTDLTNLRGLLASPDANIRQSAAETLGIRKDATALPTLVGKLNGPNRDPDHWVRQKVAAAIRNYNASTVSPHRDALINAFIANAPADPDPIDWADPLQFSNSTLSDVLFNQLAAYTINASKTTHLYPALRAGLQLPTGYYRSPVTAFARSRMNLTDLQNFFPELVVAASTDTPADRMFSGGGRADALAFMVENNITEGVEIAFAMFNDPNGFPWGSGAYVSVALNALVSYGDAARYTLPRLREVQAFWNTRLWDGGLPHGQLKDTITFLENVTSAPPATNLGKCVANPQIVTTTGAQAITLTGASPRGPFSFQKLADPSNGTLTVTSPNSFNYTPNPGFTGTDKFTFQATDSLTTSDPATVAIIVGSSGTGIAGAYFDNADFTSPVLTRTDPQINFDWGTGSPAPSIGPDTFSSRWSGYLLAPETGTYNLSSLTSDGVRAYVNGLPVINNLNDQSTRWTDGQSISLTAGQKVPLLLEYYENTGSAVAKLKWTGPSFAGLNGSIISQAYLFETNSSGGTDTTAPVITALSPADNATGVAHAADLVATFSENIVRGTTGNITIRNLSDGTQTVIPVTDTARIAIAGATLIINPTALLPGSKNHAVRIDASAITDTAGLPFPGINNDTNWNFTTTAPDTTRPTPNPMGFAVPPLTGGSTSITMTATTASDASGVEYRFNNLTLGTSGPWQNSPAYTATGLLPSNNYTFTVQARDKSAAGNTTTASAPASARTLGSGPLNLMSLNFYAFGSFAQDAVTLEAGESAGLGMFHVSGWQNYQVPWGMGSPAAPITLTSSVGSTATMRLNDVRNGGTYSESPHPLFAGGDGDLMNAQCHGTEDPYDQSALFNMDVSNIPYPSYDLIVYMGANSVHGGDRTGKIVLNGGAEQDFTLTLGFSGFTEITNATTPGNYIVFRGLTNPSLNLKVWGNGFNHLGPTGFQIVNYGAITGDTLPPVISTLNPADEATGVSVGANLVATFSENIARGTSGNITVKNLTDGTNTTIPVTDTVQVSISGAVFTINPTANLLSVKNYAVQIDSTAIKDLANNAFAGITNDTTWNFATADTPPVISSFSPADNATGVAVGTNLVATFSENIVRGTGNITIRNVSNSTSATIAVTDTTQVSISGAVLTINPTADLLPSKNYAIRIASTAIDDTAGNSYAGIATGNSTTWNFTTAAAPDTTAPTPNPMTFASPPASSGSTSISMTATTASDPSGVEYRFNNVTLGTSSPWQDSPVYTATSLIAATSYTFTVQARDKSPAQNTTTASASASATTQNAGTLDVMSVNFFAYGGLSAANHSSVTLETGESAGVGATNVSGWQNYEVPWGMDSPAAPFTLTSNLGATATLTLNDVRNGWTNDDVPSPNFGGSGDLMDSHANGTEDPYDESAKFDMAVSGIPYPVYDLIVYLRSNDAQFGDGMGKLVLNGGAVRDFTLPSGEFSGFAEITNATAPGNYIVFRKLRTPSLTLKVWGNGFNHIGPAGFQIVKDTSGILPPGPASSPNPPDTTVGHAFDTNLSWTAGIDSISRNVYFGTNPSPGASELRGNQASTTFDPGTLASGTYYWRIDEVNGDGTTTGPVWSFAVGPPAKAFRPMPWNGMKAVATNVGTLTWVAGKSATASSHDVYFGTDSTPDSSESKGNQTGTTYNPGPLTPGTTYYWRVDQVNAQGTTTGDVWSFTTPGTSANKMKVFILVGQSNMVGHGEINPIGTPGTLAYTYNNDPVTYAHLKNGSSWSVRDDAWIWYNRDGTLVKGGHTVGYGVDASNIGPELQFGHAMGQHYGQKVLLIKTAWGGKSLQTDFRPPSAGWDFDVPGKAGDKGYYFTEMLKDVLDATVNLQTHFPAYNPADGFEIAGFAWHQGFNDLISTSASAEYEANMEKFIKDLRLAVGVPNLPFVIATTGQSDPVSYSTLEQAQLAMENFTKYPAFNGNVAVVDAKPFWIPVSSSPADEGYHWNRNAKTYCMIGDALAGEMLGLQPDTTAPTPNPMTFATAPNALGQTSITMSATTASDPSSVEYFFECTAGGGHSSAWQNSPTYTDTGLTAATQYSYRVRARDKSAAQTATAWSAAASATTTNTPYGTWSGGAAFDGDANNDGVDNGMAWLLGAATPSVNAAGKLPKATRNGTHLRLTFRCLKSTMRGGVVLKVQTRSDLSMIDPWTNHEAAVPDVDSTVNGVVFDTTDDGDSIQVIADIPASGPRRFARLSAVVAVP
jgi:hypothetical protein